MWTLLISKFILINQIDSHLRVLWWIESDDSKSIVLNKILLKWRFGNTNRDGRSDPWGFSFWNEYQGERTEYLRFVYHISLNSEWHRSLLKILTQIWFEFTEKKCYQQKNEIDERIIRMELPLFITSKIEWVQGEWTFSKKI